MYGTVPPLLPLYLHGVLAITGTTFYL